MIGQLQIVGREQMFVRVYSYLGEYEKQEVGIEQKLWSKIQFLWKLIVKGCFMSKSRNKINYQNLKKEVDIRVYLKKEFRDQNQFFSICLEIISSLVVIRNVNKY